MISDYNFIARQKTTQFRDNLTNQIWNARLQRTFKNNEFTAYAMIRDILKQNIGLERSYYGNSTSQVTNDRLRQYWMIGFTWDFKTKQLHHPKVRNSTVKIKLTTFKLVR